MSKVTNECQAASAKSCNAHCDDYECEKNAGGVCRAPNPCLGYEEAGKVMAELEAAKRELALAKSRLGGSAAAHLENGLWAIMALTEASAHAHDMLGTVHRTAKAVLRQTPPIATAEKSSVVGGNAAAAREALSDILDRIDQWRTDGTLEHWQYSQLFDLADGALAAPARNCDTFGNADEALGALERHCNSSGNGCVRCPVAGCSVEEVECKIAWLFAPATEQEGGGNADK